MFIGRRRSLCIVGSLLVAFWNPRYVEAIGWSETFGTTADNERVVTVYPTADGAYLMTDGGHLTKVSAAGEVIWSRLVPAVTLNLRAGGGFLVAGFRTLIYLNGIGEVVWWRTFSSPSFIHLNNASAFPDGSLLIGAFQENRPFIAKLASNGESLWQMYVTLPGTTVSYLLLIRPQ